MQQLSSNDPHKIFQCPLCTSIPDEERESFLKDLRYTVRRYAKGEMLISQGALLEVLYIVISGEIVTEMSDEKGDYVTVENIKAPNPLAAGIVFASNNFAPVTASAIKDSVAVIIPKDNIYQLMSKYEEFMKAYLVYISNKVSFLSERLRLSSLGSIKAKVAYYVLRESRGEQQFDLKVSKEDLSRLFGVSRPALVNVMMQMADEGIIDVDRRRIVINDRRLLQQMF